MGELIELPEDASWNATTGTFDKAGTRAAEVSPEQFEELIAERFGASQLTPDQKEKALGMLDNAAVYLHEADPNGRLDRSPTVNSIASEWADLGINKRQAEFMIETSIEHTEAQHELMFGMDREEAIARMDEQQAWEDDRRALGFHTRGEDEMEL